MASRVAERETIQTGDIFGWLKRAEYIDPLSGPAICSKIIVLLDEEWSDNPGKCPDNEQRDAIEKHIEEVTALGLPYRIPDPTNNKYGLFRVSSEARSKFSDYGDIGRQAELLVDGVKARIAKVIGSKSLTRYCPYIVSPENASSFDLLLPPATVASVLDLSSRRRELPFFEVSEEGKRDVVVFADCIRREFGIPLNVGWTSVGQEAREFLWYTVEKGKAAKQRMIDGKALRGDELSYLLFEASALVIVEENMGLVVREIKRRFSGFIDKYFGILLIYGAEGLFKSVLKYDPRKGNEFSTAAYPNIMASLQNFPDELSWHGISRSGRNLARRIRRAEDELKEKGIEPTDEAVAVFLNLKDVSSGRVATNRATHHMMIDIAHLEGFYMDRRGDQNYDWEDVFSFEAVERPTEVMAIDAINRQKKAWENVFFPNPNMVASLNERQIGILELLSESEDELTNKQIGERFDVSRETIRTDKLLLIKLIEEWEKEH